MQLGNKAYKQKPSRWLTNNTEKLVSEVYLRLSNLNQSMACSSKQEKTNMLLLLLHMCTNIQKQPAGCLGRETRCTVCHMGQVRSRILQLSRPGGSIQGESCRGVRRDQLDQLISSKGPLLPCCIADSSVHGEGGIIWSNGPDKGNTMDATLIDAHTYCIQQYS